MKTTAECYKALSEGRILISCYGGKTMLKDGTGVQIDPDTNNYCHWVFDCPEDWEIYEPPPKP